MVAAAIIAGVLSANVWKNYSVVYSVVKYKKRTDGAFFILSTSLICESFLHL